MLFSLKSAEHLLFSPFSQRVSGLGLRYSGRQQYWTGIEWQHLFCSYVLTLLSIFLLFANDTVVLFMVKVYNFFVHCLLFYFFIISKYYECINVLGYMNHFCNTWVLAIAMPVTQIVFIIPIRLVDFPFFPNPGVDFHWVLLPSLHLCAHRLVPI